MPISATPKIPVAHTIERDRWYDVVAFPQERDLLSAAYKHIMSAHRAARGTIIKFEEKETDPEVWGTAATSPFSIGREKQAPVLISRAICGSLQRKMILKAYKKTVVAEVDIIINRINNEVICHMLEGPLAAKQPVNWIFYKKLQADYYRYGAEMAPPEEVDDARRYYKEKAREAYLQAQTCAEAEATTMPPPWAPLNRPSRRFCHLPT